MSLLAELKHSFRTCGIAPYFDAVAISGDLTSNNQPNGYDAARFFLERLVTDGCCSERRLVLVPGNHDIYWGPPLAPAAPPFGYVARYEAEQGYREMASRVLGSPEPEFDLHCLSYILVSPTQQVMILAMNSCRIEGPQTAALGYVGYDQLWEAMETFHFRYELAAYAGGYVKIAVPLSPSNTMKTRRK